MIYFPSFSWGLFVVSWNYGLGAITWLWLSEIYPMEIRGLLWAAGPLFRCWGQSLHHQKPFAGQALSACGVIKWISCFFIVLIARFLPLVWQVKNANDVTLSSAFSCLFQWPIDHNRSKCCQDVAEELAFVLCPLRSGPELSQRTVVEPLGSFRLRIGWWFIECLNVSDELL